MRNREDSPSGQVLRFLFAFLPFSATIFAALTHHAGIKAAICCVALLNRLHGDQVSDAGLSVD